MHKRVFAPLILLWLLCVPLLTQAAAAGAAVSVSAGQVRPGESVEVSVRIAGNPGLAAWMFRVSWDTGALSLDLSEGGAAEAGPAFAAGTLLAKQTDTGLTTSWFSINEVDAGGELFRFRLKASPSASGEYPITVTCSEQNTINIQEEQVAVSGGSGTVTVTGTGSAGPGPDSQGAEASGSGRPSGGDTNAQETESESDGTSTPVETGNPFRDVSAGAYYYDAVLWAARQGITTGTGPAQFSPDAVCTRAQMVTFLWRAAGSPQPVVMGNTFTDVAPGSYYFQAVRWAAENGITSGTSEHTFSPDNTVTRAQVVTFLWRLAGSKRAEGTNPFADVPADQYYSHAVLWAVTNGLTSGTSATAFSPEDGCTRGQIVTFLYRDHNREA